MANFRMAKFRYETLFRVAIEDKQPLVIVTIYLPLRIIETKLLDPSSHVTLEEMRKKLGSMPHNMMKEIHDKILEDNNIGTKYINIDIPFRKL